MLFDLYVETVLVDLTDPKLDPAAIVLDTPEGELGLDEALEVAGVELPLGEALPEGELYYEIRLEYRKDQPVVVLELVGDLEVARWMGVTFQQIELIHVSDGKSYVDDWETAQLS